MCKFACLCDNMLQQRHSTCHNASHYILTLPSFIISIFHLFHILPYAHLHLCMLLFFAECINTEWNWAYQAKVWVETTLDCYLASKPPFTPFHVTHMSQLEIYVNLWCSLLHAYLSLPACCCFYILSCSSMDYSCFIAIKDFENFKHNPMNI